MSIRLVIEGEVPEPSMTEGEFEYSYSTKKGTQVLILSSEGGIVGSFITTDDSSGPLRWRRDETNRSLVRCSPALSLGSIGFRHGRVCSDDRTAGRCISGIHIHSHWSVDYGPTVGKFTDLPTGHSIVGLYRGRIRVSSVEELITYNLSYSNDRESVLFWGRLVFPESVFGSVETFDFEDSDEQIKAIVI